MTHQVIDYLLFDCGLAPYVPNPWLFQVVILWLSKPFVMLSYPFYWVLGCNMTEVHTLLTQTEVPQLSRQQTIRIVDNYCKPNDVAIFMVLMFLFCGGLFAGSKRVRS
ncbi:MAG: hypothetical protein CMP20_09245 [Rickettsiales bacterium]|nr:hypothetical protein [Rickettsiales bacterium]